jgi:hypothetical protein
MRITLVLVSLALASAAFATAQTTASPITINSCGPKLDSDSGQSAGGVTLSSKSEGIRIEFTNESSKTANLVNFAVDSNGEQFVIRDVGTFSPGISIKHNYRNGEGQAFVLPQFIAPKIKCRVSSVRFTDGSVWERGVSSQPASGAPMKAARVGPLSASPSRLTLATTTESQLFLVSSTDRVSAFKETDNCKGVAAVFVAATGESSATYSVKPSAPGSCTANITDENGNSIAVPIVVSTGG